jgi:hypothetical protein
MKKKEDFESTREAMEEFIRSIEDSARDELIPKMRKSAFVMAALSANDDLFLALQIGLALLLDKPLMIVAPESKWISPRLRSVAEAVVTGSMSDPDMQEKLRAAVLIFMRKHKTQGGRN